MGLESGTAGTAAEQADVDCKAVASQVPQKRYRGVTKHRRSGRWEAHIWVRELGRQVYLGGYEHAEHAAEAYDVAAIKCRGFKVKTNFDVDRYSNLTESMDSISLEEVIMAVRRQSRGFSRGTSAYRGVTHHPSGRWEARIGIPAKVYLGLFSMETEAAQAYDRALVRLRGTAAATNFALSDYRTDLAAYHKMQQAALQSDQGIGALQSNNLNFERWIKHGLTAEELMNSSNLSAEVPSQGTVAGAVAVVTASAGRKRTRIRSPSPTRTRSPPWRVAGERSEQEHSTRDDASDDQSGTPEVEGCVLADLARHLLKAYTAVEKTHNPGQSQAEQRLGEPSTAAGEQVPAAAPAQEDLVSNASEEISTCSEMQSSDEEEGRGDETQSDDSMHGHSIVGADTAQAKSTAISPAQRPNQPEVKEQGLHVAHAQGAAVHSDVADSRPEASQLHSQALHKSTELPSPNAGQAPERQVGQTDVKQAACSGVLQAQVEKLRAELSGANQRCTGYEAKLQAARAQYQEQQRRIVALENVVYDLRLHVCQSS